MRGGDGREGTRLLALEFHHTDKISKLQAITVDP